MWQKVVKWFGYKLHLIVDADYELPVAFEVTKASCSEIPQGRELIRKLRERHEELAWMLENRVLFALSCPQIDIYLPDVVRRPLSLRGGFSVGTKKEFTTQMADS